MNDYKVSWTDNEGLEFFSEYLKREDAFILFNEICKNKVDEDQIEACLYDPDNFPIKTYNNIENKLYVM